MDIQVKESHERLRTQQRVVDKEVKLIEAGIEETEALLERSTSAEIIKLDKSLNAIFQEEVTDGEDQVDCDLEGFRRFTFAENEALMAKTVTEGIGVFQTFISYSSANQSSVKGKRTRKAVVGREAQLVLTTRNAEGEQCSDERDGLTKKMRICETKARVQNNNDGNYKINYFAKETGKCDFSVKVRK